MSTLRMKDFIEYTGTDGRLIKAVKSQTGLNWEDFQNELGNVSNSPCGAAAGFNGFIYFSETVEFWRKNRNVILERMKQLAWELGENVLSMVLSFGGIKNGDFSEDEVGRALYDRFDSELTSIYYVFAWFALEEVAHWYSDFEYENR